MIRKKDYIEIPLKRLCGHQAMAGWQERSISNEDIGNLWALNAHQTGISGAFILPLNGRRPHFYYSWKNHFLAMERRHCANIALSSNVQYCNVDEHFWGRIHPRSFRGFIGLGWIVYASWVEGDIKDWRFFLVKCDWFLRFLSIILFFNRKYKSLNERWWKKVQIIVKKISPKNMWNTTLSGGLSIWIRSINYLTIIIMFELDSFGIMESWSEFSDNRLCETQLMNQISANESNLILLFPFFFTFYWGVVLFKKYFH